MVIAIIGLLIGLLLPAVQAAREASRRAECANKLKQIGLGVQNYTDANRVIPPSMGFDGAGQARGWIVGILPYIEESALYDQFAGVQFNIKDPNCLPLMQKILPALLCPSDDSSSKLSNIQLQWTGTDLATTNYKGVIGDTQMGGASSIWIGTLPDTHNISPCNGLFWRLSYKSRQVAANHRRHEQDVHGGRGRAGIQRALGVVVLERRLCQLSYAAQLLPADQ